MHKLNNLKSSYHFLKNFLARCARSISFYPHLEMKGCNVVYELHLYIFFVFFWASLFLTDSFQNSLKTRTNCTKLRMQCPKFVCGVGVRRRGWRKGGRRENRAIAPWLLGDRRPWQFARKKRAVFEELQRS